MRMILLLFLLCTLTVGQELEALIGLALENSKVVQVSVQEVNVARLRSQAVRLDRLPSLDLTMQYRHVSEVPTLALELPAPLPSQKMDLGVYDTYESGLDLSMPLFTGFAVSNNIALAKTGLEVQELSLEQQKKNMAMSVIRLYRKIQGLYWENAGVRAARMRTLLQLEKVSSLVSQGMALPTDTLSLRLAELQFSQQELALNAAMRKMQNQLEVLVGQPVRVEFRSIPLAKLNPEARFDSTSEALQLSFRQIRLSGIKKDLIKAAYWPNLTLQLSYKYGKPGVNFIKNEWMDYAVIGLQLRWNLYRWGADAKRIQAGQADQQKAEWQHREITDQLKTGFQNALEDWQTTKQQATISARALEIARRQFAVTESQYAQGTLSSLDYNAANLDLTRAETNYNKSRIELALQLQEINYISGKPLSEWRP